MNLRLVRVQTAQFFEQARTVRARQTIGNGRGPFRVHPKCVHAQVVFLGKFQPAQRTTKVVDTTVRKKVRIKGGLLIETFGADFALERFLFRVYQKMPFQKAFFWESLVAKITLVQLLDIFLYYVDFNFSPSPFFMSLVHVRL